MEERKGRREKGDKWGERRKDERRENRVELKGRGRKKLFEGFLFLKFQGNSKLSVSLASHIFFPFPQFPASKVDSLWQGQGNSEGFPQNEWLN